MQHDNQARRFRQAQREGLWVKARRAGARDLTSTRVVGSIARAKNRGSISKEAARRCVLGWPEHLAAHSQDAKWSRYVSAELLTAARYRLRGDKSAARAVLAAVRHANQSIIRSPLP